MVSPGKMPSMDNKRTHQTNHRSSRRDLRRPGARTGARGFVDDDARGVNGARKPGATSRPAREFGQPNRRTRYDHDAYPDSFRPSAGAGSAGKPPRGTRPSTRSVAPKKRRRFLPVLAALLALVLIGGVGVFAYFQVLEGNLHAGLDDDLKNVLVESDVTSEPFYMLLLGTDKSDERDASGDFGEVYRSDSIMLARIDPVDKKATLISLHRDTLLDMGEYGNQKLNAAYSLGGASYMVETVSKLAGVPISHYAEVNFDGFKDIVDALGGVEVNVPMEIDDADAGGHLDAGPQTLNGDQALILCRSRHAYDDFGDGDSYRAANQRLVLSAIAKKVLSSDIVTMTNTVQALSNYVTTDLSITEIVAIAQALNGMDVSKDLYSAMEPTTSLYIDGDGWYEINSLDEWKAMMARVDQGLPPTEKVEIDEASGTVLATTGDGSVDPSADSGNVQAEGVQEGGTVIVRNGSGIDGVASEAAEKLSSEGYTVETGNADDFSYEETLIVFNENSQGAQAKEIASLLGIGRTQLNHGTYDFDGDFLVVVGSDWNQ